MYDLDLYPLGGMWTVKRMAVMKVKNSWERFKLVG